MNPLAHPNTWQLAGGFILKNATLQIAKTTLEQVNQTKTGNICIVQIMLVSCVDGKVVFCGVKKHKFQSIVSRLIC